MTSDFDIADGDDLGLDEEAFPYVAVPQYVALNEDVTADELGVHVFILTHLNPYQGKATARFGRKRIAERFGKSLDWVDTRLRGLATKGALRKLPTYWVDSRDRKTRTLERYDEAGNPRAQASNYYKVKTRPLLDGAWPKPIKVAEFYRPKLIEQRLKRNGATGELSTSEDTPSDQHESESSQVTPQPPHSGPGGPPHSGPGGAATQRPRKNTGNRKTTGMKDHGSKGSGYREGSRTSNPLANEPTADRAAEVVTQQQDQVGESPHAHACDPGPRNTPTSQEETQR